MPENPLQSQASPDMAVPGPQGREDVGAGEPCPGQRAHPEQGDGVGPALDQVLQLDAGKSGQGLLHVADLGLPAGAVRLVVAAR